MEEEKKKKKSKGISPTQRSLAHMREQGFDLVQVVEHWNPHAFIRQDLFGIIDILGIKGEETVAVQTTSGSAVSARIRKMQESEALPFLRKAGWRILVHGWRKIKVTRGGIATKWELREVDIS